MNAIDRRRELHRCLDRNTHIWVVQCNCWNLTESLLRHRRKLGNRFTPDQHAGIGYSVFQHSIGSKLVRVKSWKTAGEIYGKWKSRLPTQNIVGTRKPARCWNVVCREASKPIKFRPEPQQRLHRRLALTRRPLPYSEEQCTITTSLHPFGKLPRLFFSNSEIIYGGEFIAAQNMP